MNKIFSGDRSIDMWKAINSADNNEDLKYALQVVCCRLQEFEDHINKDVTPIDHLDKIRTWPAQDLAGLMRYIMPIWMHYGTRTEEYGNGGYRLSTGGLSGNKEIIDAMQENYAWWALNWMKSERGGHYTFGKSP